MVALTLSKANAFIMFQKKNYKKKPWFGQKRSVSRWFDAAVNKSKQVVKTKLEKKFAVKLVSNKKLSKKSMKSDV